MLANTKRLFDIPCREEWGSSFVAFHQVVFADYLLTEKYIGVLFVTCLTCLKSELNTFLIFIFVNYLNYIINIWMNASHASK